MSRQAGPAPVVAAMASVALRYPGPDVLERRGELARLATELPAGRAAAALGRFFAWWLRMPALALEEAYVETFDLQRRCSLYLTYYVYGDRRQRGQEFVRLKRAVESAGYRFAGHELPDYLPLLLEFAAREPEAGRAVLAEHRVGLELLGAALRDAGSPYADVVDAICLELPPLDETRRELVRRIAADGPPTETIGLEPFAPPEVMPDSAWGTPPR